MDIQTDTRRTYTRINGRIYTDGHKTDKHTNVTTDMKTEIQTDVRTDTSTNKKTVVNRTCIKIYGMT